MKQKKFLEKVIVTDSDVSLSISSTNTRIIGVGRRETRGKSGAAITLRDVDGKELTALLTEAQLADLISKLKELGKFILLKNYKCSF